MPLPPGGPPASNTAQKRALYWAVLLTGSPPGGSGIPEGPPQALRGGTPQEGLTAPFPSRVFSGMGRMLLRVTRAAGFCFAALSPDTRDAKEATGLCSEISPRPGPPLEIGPPCTEDKSLAGGPPGGSGPPVARGRPSRRPLAEAPLKRV
jgi:hypothetical protein